MAKEIDDDSYILLIDLYCILKIDGKNELLTENFYINLLNEKNELFTIKIENRSKNNYLVLLKHN
jgi:hypothetical protein